MFLARDGPGDIRRKRDEGPLGTWASIFPQLRECERALKATSTDLAEAVRVDHAITESGKWLLDNSHLFRPWHCGDPAIIAWQAPGRFLSRFTTSAGELRVLKLARSTVGTGHNVITEQNLVDAVNEYQKTTLFSIAELWVFPTMLRFAFVELLASLAKQVTKEQSLREFAYLWANRLAAAAHAEDPDSVTQMLRQLETQPWAREPYFVICLAEQLQDQEAALVFFRHWVETQMGSSLSDVIPAEHHMEAAESMAIANAITSLRNLSQIDFAEVFEHLSAVEQELRRDPAGTYPRNDFKTRDRCRRTVEAIARRSRVAEVDVARRAVDRARSATDPEQGEICWHLLGAGIRSLEREFEARIPFRVRMVRFLRAHATFFYVTSVLGLTLCFAAAALSPRMGSRLAKFLGSQPAGIAVFVPSQRTGAPGSERYGHRFVPSRTSGQARLR